MNPEHFVLVLFGIFGVWNLFITVRGLVTKKPFLISDRLNKAIYILPPFAIILVYALTGAGMLRWIFPVVFAFLGIILWFRPRGYLAYGVTEASLKGGLLASLKKLNVTYEETPEGLRLPTIGADLKITSPRSWWRLTGSLNMNQREFDGLLGDIAKEMSAYYQTGAVTAMNRRYMIEFVAWLVFFILLIFFLWT